MFDPDPTNDAVARSEPVPSDADPSSEEAVETPRTITVGAAPGAPRRIGKLGRGLSIPGRAQPFARAAGKSVAAVRKIKRETRVGLAALLSFLILFGVFLSNRNGSDTSESSPRGTGSLPPKLTIGGRPTNPTPVPTGSEPKTPDAETETKIAADGSKTSEPENGKAAIDVARREAPGEIIPTASSEVTPPLPTEPGGRSLLVARNDEMPSLPPPAEGDAKLEVPPGANDPQVPPTPVDPAPKDPNPPEPEKDKPLDLPPPVASDVKPPEASPANAPEASPANPPTQTTSGETKTPESPTAPALGPDPASPQPKSEPAPDKPAAPPTPPVAQPAAATTPLDAPKPEASKPAVETPKPEASKPAIESPKPDLPKPTVETPKAEEAPPKIEPAKPEPPKPAVETPMPVVQTPEPSPSTSASERDPLGSPPAPLPDLKPAASSPSLNEKTQPLAPVSEREEPAKPSDNADAQVLISTPSVAPPSDVESKPTASPTPRPSEDAELSRAKPAPRVEEAPLPPGWVRIKNVGKRLALADAVPPTPRRKSVIPDGPTPKSPVIADSIRQPIVVHVVERNENFWTISRLYYGSGRYYKALWNANRVKVPDIRKLYVGTEIRIPQLEDLDSSMFEPAAPSTIASKSAPTRSNGSSAPKMTRSLSAADAIPKRASRRETDGERPVSFEEESRPSYRVREHDNLRSIAKETLGDGHRYREILLLNREIIDDPNYLPPGIDIVLPADAVVRRRYRE